MIQLALVRHAAAEHGSRDLDDHDRPLSSRGVREAADVARRVLRSGVRAEAVLSSTALRARTTAEAFGHALEAPVSTLTDLYAAPARTILDIAKASDMSEVMIVAHDPGMSALVSELAETDVPMTTCAVALFTWDDGSWGDVGALPPDDFSLTTP